jgi:hypothetical protein
MERRKQINRKKSDFVRKRQKEGENTNGTEDIKCSRAYSVHTVRCAFCSFNGPGTLWERYLSSYIFRWSNIPALTSVSETGSTVLITKPRSHDSMRFLEWFIWQAFVRRYTCHVFACSL